MSASLVWRPVPVDPEPLGTSKHPLLGLIYEAFKTDEAGLRPGLAVSKDDDAVTFLRGALAALPTRLPAGATRDHPDWWRVELHEELAGLLADIDRLGEVLIEVRR